MANNQTLEETKEVVILTPEMEEEIKQANDRLIMANLSSLPITKEQLAELQKLRELKITSLEDKQVYKEIDRSRKDVKALRLAIQRREKEILETPKLFINKIKEGVAQWVDELQDIEKTLDAEQQKYDDMVAEEKRKKDEAEKKLIDDRCNLIESIGAELKGSAYFIGDHSIHLNDVADFKEDEFERWVDQAKAISDQIKKDKAKSDLINWRKSAIGKCGMFFNEEAGSYMRAGFDQVISEANLFELSNEEFDVILGDLIEFDTKEKQRIADLEKREAEQKRIEEENKAAQEKMKRDIANNRHLTLKNLGFNLIGESYYIGSAADEEPVCTKSDVFESDDEKWAGIFTKAEQVSNEYKKLQEEIIEKERIKKEMMARFVLRVSSLKAMGLIAKLDGFEINSPSFEELAIEQQTLRFTEKDVMEADEQLFESYMNEANAFRDLCRSNANKIEEYKAKKRQEEIDAMIEAVRPDADVIREVIKKISSLKVDQAKMKTEHGRKAAEKTNHAIDLCIEELDNIHFNIIE